MSHRYVCRYFIHGACRRGDSCQYSHDVKARPSAVCTYYQRGACSYGDRCRYDHVKPDKQPSNAHVPTESPRNDNNYTASPSKPLHNSKNSDSKSNMFVLKKGANPTRPAPKLKKHPEKWEEASVFVPGRKWRGRAGPSSYSGAACSGLEQREDSVVIGAEAAHELCPYALQGDCRWGSECRYTHGHMCDVCGRHALVPGDAAQNEQHTKACIQVLEDDMERSFALKRSADKACGICMETVLEKTPHGQRKFGILSNCNHVFCLSCIRTWRQAKQFENKIVRACPECRVQSDFVTPSSYWVEEKEEKEKVIDNYKAALSKKPCKYFDEGAGECPFNDKCFYRHAYPDGRLASPKPRRRRQRHDQDGGLDLMRELILWDFIEEREGREGDGVLDSMEELLLHLRFAHLLQDVGTSSDSDSDYEDLLEDTFFL